MFRFIRKYKTRITHLGGLEEKKEALRKVDEVTDKINYMMQEMERRFHQAPVAFDRRRIHDLP